MSWKTVKLGDVATFVNGYAFKPSDWSDSGLEIIRIQNLTKGSSETNFFKGSIPEKYKIISGDILISWSATLDIFVWEGCNAWLNQHIFKVVFDKVEINRNYFIYAIKNILGEMRKQVHGATMQHITKGKFDNLQIPLPPLETQKRIAEILDAADALRRKDQELLKKYDELAQAIFIDMFGDPVRNEKGWEVNKGRDVVKVLGGAAFKSTDYKDDGIPLIRIGAINKGYFDKSQIVFLPYDFAISHERYIVKPKDLLITLTGTVGKDDYGNVYIMEEHFDQYLLNQRVAKLIVKQDYLMTRFFEFLLKQKEVKAELTGVSRGVRQANISNEDIYNLDVILPPLALQNDFVERINSVYGLIETSTNSSLVSDIFFNSLIQKAFKGKLI
jgi:type I restriction enzyme S subunit